MSGNECPSRKLLTRRRVLASAGVLPAAGVLISQTDPAAAAVAWTGYVSPESGASVKYPATWGLDTDVVTELVYPKQSFAVRSGGQPGGYIEDIPDLHRTRQMASFCGFCIMMICRTARTARLFGR